MKPVRIVHEEELLLVADKPLGLPSHATKDPNRMDLTRILESQVGISPLRTLNRLDLMTTGLIAFGKPPFTKEKNKILDEVMKHSKKKYLFVASGRPNLDSGRIELYLKEKKGKMEVVRSGGDKAITEWRVCEKGENHFLGEALLLTGRRHQIRISLATIGHPLLNDDLYGGGKGGNFFLHSYHLEWENKILRSLPDDHWKILGYDLT